MRLHRWISLRAVLMLLGVVALASAGSARAAGLLVPTGQTQSLAIASQQVSVRIDNGVAVTTVNQVFRNAADAPLEALYTFPVPREASVSNFSMWINGQEVIGEVLERQRAREIYRQVTRVERRDPGLLEQVDFKTFEMRVFPVPARGEQRIQITYYQPVDYDSGFGTYVYPLEMEGGAQTQLEGEFSLLVDVASEIPLKKVSSPSHGEALVQAEVGPGRYRASIESARGNLDRDFVLVYELERERLGLNVLTSRAKGEDGYFMLLLTPGAAFDDTKQSVNATFVLDVSGSMQEAGKLGLARQAAGLAIASLDDNDTFNIVAFNIAPRPLAEAPLPATAENRQRAIEFLNGLQGRGSTDIAGALDYSLRMQVPGARNAIVLLSDGQATATDEHAPFLAALRSRDREAQIFSLGMGNEVNRPLLDQLAAQTGGFADYVSGQDDVERKMRLLQVKLMSPMAKDLEVKAEGVELFDVSPGRLPNLFRGQQLVLFGRYRGAGSAQVTVSGTFLERSELVAEKVTFPELDKTHPFLERMWASRQVDERLARLRAGEDSAPLINEVVKLGTEYSIVTPFTAFLVLENESEYQRFSIERRNPQRIENERAALERQFALTPGPAEQLADNGSGASPLTNGGSGGGGGSVEWLFLGSLGALGVGNWARRRKGRAPSPS